MQNRPAAPETWLTAIPMRYFEGPAFWKRDAGLMCLALRKSGINSRFVAIGEPAVRNDVPLILGSLEQFSDARWWKQWNADGVVWHAGGAPRYVGVAKAIRESGARLVLRMDSQGNPSPRVNFRSFLEQNYYHAFDRGTPLPWFYAMAKSVIFKVNRQAFDTRLCRYLSHADLIIIESPLAKATFCRYLSKVQRDDLIERVCVIPHPALDDLRYDPSQSKRAQIIAVGRWQAYAKDAPLLMRVLASVLGRLPNHQAVLYGSGSQVLEELRKRMPLETQKRIEIAGAVSHDAVCAAYQSAQVIFFSSRVEGFPVAAAEALCCGCSVVGPAKLRSLNFIASQGAGTVSPSRQWTDMGDALAAELEIWRLGRRNPVEISRNWNDLVSASSVVRQVFRHLGENGVLQP
jgi:glycosyltransferase involved in cell wall biosynthesis